MKRQFTCLAIMMILLIDTPIVFGQETKIKFSGNFLTDQRMMLQNDFEWVWNENRLDLQLEGRIGKKVKFFTDVWLRNIGMPDLVSVNELYNKNIVQPYNLFIREGYVEFYGFLSKNLDLKIGKQRIAWGTADKLNPTDNLNPYDYEDIMDFGRHTGSIAINMTYYFKNDFSLQAVYIPYFEPATTPIGVYAVAFEPELVVPEPFYVNYWYDSLAMPSFSFTQSATTGIKLKCFAAGFDLSASYVWGYNGLPVPYYNNIMIANATGGLNIQSTEIFFRNHIFGADMAGSIGPVGIWAEGAVFLPESSVILTNDLNGAPFPEFDSTILEKEPYVKFIVGMDYTFRDASYINFQYLHGFVNEYGKASLNDYFVLDYSKSFFEEKLKLNPVTGAFIVSNWSDLPENYALAWIPSLEYRPVLNAAIKLGAYIYAGKGQNQFVRLVGYDMLFLQVNLNF